MKTEEPSIKGLFLGQPVFRRFKELRTQLDEFVVAQEEAKDWLAIAAAEHEFGIARREGSPRVVLLVGPPGCGKTELCRELARILQVPFCRLDAQELSHTSFRGRQLGDIVLELKRDLEANRAGVGDSQSSLSASRRGGPRDSITYGVVVLDEIDKIRFIPDERATAVQERHFEAVQATLLPLFEGKRIPFEDASLVRENRVESFNASKLLIIAAGSFAHSDMERIVREREGKNPPSARGHWSFIRHEDILRFGFLPELVGRIRAIVPVERLHRDSLKKIFLKMLEREDYRIGGWRVTCAAGVADRIAESASAKNLGARAVDMTIEQIRLHVYQQREEIRFDAQTKTILLSAEYAQKYWPEFDTVQS